MARLMWVLSLLATLAFSAAAATFSSPPTPSVDCDSVIPDMTDCLAYVSKGSKRSRPDKACCQGVSSVVKLSPTCLCAALKEAINMGVDLDMKRAAGLPAACSIKVSVGDCDIATPPPSLPGPAPSPTPTPTPAPPSPPKVTPTPPPPPSKPTPLPPPHSPAVPPPHSPSAPPTPRTPAPPSKTPPSPVSPPKPSTPPSPAPAPVEPANVSSATRRLRISVMTAMIALVVAACSS